MATVGSLVVNFTAKTAAFLKGTKKARQSIARFGSTVSQIGKSIAKLGAAGAAAAVGGLSLLVKKESDAIAQTTLLARRLGGSTKEIARLQAAAGKTGVTADQFNDALSDMVERIGDARMEGGELREVLKSTGLEADRLAQKGPAAAFKAIATAISNAGTQADKLTLADKAFGDVGQRLVPLLDRGREGIDKLTRSVERMGLTFSNTEGEQVIQMQRAMASLGKVVVGLGRQITINLAPFITAAAKKLKSMASAGGGMAETVVSGFESVVKGVAKVADWLNLLKAGWQTLKGVILRAFKALLKPLNTLLKRLGDLGEALGIDALKSAGAFGDALDKDLGNRSEEAFDRAGKAFEKFQKGVNANSVASAFDDIREKSKKLAEQAVKDSEKMRGAASSAGTSSGAAAGAVGAADDFRQIVRSRVALGGVRGDRTQRVKDPQLEETNALLRQLVGSVFPAAASRG